VKRERTPFCQADAQFFYSMDLDFLPFVIPLLLSPLVPPVGSANLEDKNFDAFQGSVSLIDPFPLSIRSFFFLFLFLPPLRITCTLLFFLISRPLASRIFTLKVREMFLYCLTSVCSSPPSFLFSGRSIRFSLFFPLGTLTPVQVFWSGRPVTNLEPPGGLTNIRCYP